MDLLEIFWGVMPVVFMGASAAPMMIVAALFFNKYARLSNGGRSVHCTLLVITTIFFVGVCSVVMESYGLPYGICLIAFVATCIALALIASSGVLIYTDKRSSDG